MRKRTYIQWTFLLLVSPNEGLYHFVVLPTSTSIKYCSHGLKKHLDTYIMIWSEWYYLNMEFRNNGILALGSSKWVPISLFNIFHISNTSWCHRKFDKMLKTYSNLLQILLSTLKSNDSNPSPYTSTDIV